MQTNAAQVVRVHDLTHDDRELDLRCASRRSAATRSGLGVGSVRQARAPEKTGAERRHGAKDEVAC